MKIFYTQETPFGELFYDDSSRRAIIINGGVIQTLKMPADYNPHYHKGSKEIEIPDDLFDKVRLLAEEISFKTGSLERMLNPVRQLTFTLS